MTNDFRIRLLRKIAGKRTVLLNARVLGIVEAKYPVLLLHNTDILAGPPTYGKGVTRIGVGIDEALE